MTLADCEPGHPLARVAPAVPVDRLAAEPVVHYDASHGLAGWLDETMAAHGVVLSVAMRSRQTSAPALLAAAGLGVAFVPVTAVPVPFPGALRRLDPPLHREIVVLVGAASDPLTQRFAADLSRRGVPVPAEIDRKLAAT
ncbi:LysR substrate-binding domain-containing protein [Micromonospora sp. GCM10011542]|uniref:LysR substrate-binding domain-containing protein n=1 Tax=Micromonospora sp. GCM10011542 TaxID=3317337 RepID=UPI0036246835